MHVKSDEVRATNSLPRDISRFKCLYPNGRATIRDDATPTLAFMSSYEMTIATEKADRQ